MFKKILLSLLVVLASYGVSSAQYVWKELDFNYENGSSALARNAKFDTLVDNTNPDTVKIGLIYTDINRLGAYPNFVVVMIENVEDINNGERITVLDEYGIRDVTVEGSLAVGDTVTSAATAGVSARMVYNTGSASGNPGTHLQLVINQLASAAATDSISYRLRAFGVYTDKGP